ncbi:MAG: phosphate starvation-inducible protein PhoH [Burkholderiales bacterium RIFCSPHIGHO2_12_FULL_67_38]|nr:MAG: phosphate starvation-inducible protein PhoH [Burkholderiales bacterium RIFCSPLOWO2_02_FULL_67_64]OGB43457.1 MAG: phosphate starvation-inducible protein PhoH [Burkholderiales bacterium RIFCSPHIGHO2_12_FULL_67_38]OGB75464.1 MAG: phosphate starvation-inducible protein PhoH [Burkholderiales bacterium RIFCSPLOWO2_12_FULL_67_210]
MPLPPAPSKRAALLSPDAYNLKAADDPFDLADTLDQPQPVAAPAPRVETTVTALTPKTGRRSPQSRTRKSPPTDKPSVTPKAEATATVVALPVVQPTEARIEKSRQELPAVAEKASAPSPVASNRRRSPGRPNGAGLSRLFVLDTNVLLHDPMSLFRFEEHDIFLPMIVLEELDGHKKGMTEVARNGRQTSRTLDALAAQQGGDMARGLKLSATGHQTARGLLFFQTEPLDAQLPSSLPQGKADNQILGVVHALRDKHPQREVILVSKDINMRVKARALGLAAEDYQNDKTLDDGELLYAGALALPQDFWTRQSKTIESWQSGSHTFYRVSGPAVGQFYINQFVYFEAPGEPSLYARVTEIRDKTAVLKTLKDFTHLKNAVWGVTSRNREQNFALNLLMDPEIDFVTLAGTAGTGKTLMALASGLTQVLDDRRYTEIIMTRATVSVGEDIGFLPGTEEEKMGPWMGALDDNLEFLAKGDGGNAGEWGRAATNELIRSRIKVKSMNFMRGRTFMNKYVIIDEAQNLTPKQMKTLITRAGPGTKIICMGNLAQIDTPYLTEGSSGLTFAVDRFKGWPHGGHITLARGERSRLADFASEVL